MTPWGTDPATWVGLTIAAVCFAALGWRARPRRVRLDRVTRRLLAGLARAVTR